MTAVVAEVLERICEPGRRVVSLPIYNVPISVPVCINHIIKPNVDLSSPNHGNCLDCRPDVNNQDCSGYFPIRYSLFDVSE